MKSLSFKRGVIRITAACGTGATSCAMLARALALITESQDIQICLKAGKIRIHPNKDASIMSGPAYIEKSESVRVCAFNYL